MGGSAESLAIDRTHPRDRLQEQFVKILARPVRAGEDDKAKRRVADLRALIESADLSAGLQLQRRLANDRDALTDYFDSRLSGANCEGLRQALQLHLIGVRGVEPPPEQQLSTSNDRAPSVKPSAAARKLVEILKRRVPAGSAERFERVHALFKNLDLIDAVRLRERLSREGDELRQMLFDRLTDEKAAWLIEHVLKPRARGLRVAELPENLSSEQIETRMNQPVLLKEARTGAIARREEQSYREALFEEASARGEAESVASPERRSDIDLETKYPGLSARAIRGVLAEVAENKDWLDREGVPGVKPALSKFLIELELLRRIASASGDDLVQVIGTWANLMRADHPKESGTYLGVWTRAMGRSAVILERRFKTSLARRGYIWIQAVVMPGPLEFVMELHRTGELFELKNFKAAALGGLDALVAVAKGLVAMADPATWKQIYKDFAEHGVDVIHAFKRETIDLFASQLRRDFDAFARLDETQQARTASFVLTSAVIDRKLPEVAEAAAGKAKVAARRLFESADEASLPPATAQLATHNPKTGKKYLIGKRLRGAFRRWALGKITKEHPLHFLVRFDDDGNAVEWLGKSFRHEDLIDDPLSVDAGHTKSESLVEVHGRLEHERVVLELRWDNRALSSTVENKGVAGLGFEKKPAIDIEGVPVGLASVKIWVQEKLLDAKFLDPQYVKTHSVSGWNQDP